MSQVNWSNCAKYALDYAVRSGRGRFKRISKSQVQPDLDRVVREYLRKLVDTHPSKGITLQLYTKKRRKDGDG